jgi:hypothetical protein
MAIQIIHRSAETDFHSWIVAQAMENVNCTVISISRDIGYNSASSLWRIWGKFDDSVCSFDQIDEAISSQINEINKKPIQEITQQTLGYSWAHRAFS